MTHPLTPREKVLLKPCPFCGGEAVAGSNFDNDHYVMCGADCDKCGGMVGYMKTEMAAIENWNRRTALASGSGDHAELAREIERMKWGQQTSNGTMKIADRCLSLIAENEALRGERGGMIEEVSRSQARLHAATEAERKLAEAVGIASKLSAAISWLDYPFIDNNTSEDELRSRVGFMMKDAEQPRAILSKEAERG